MYFGGSVGYIFCIVKLFSTFELPAHQAHTAHTAPYSTPRAWQVFPTNEETIIVIPAPPAPAKKGGRRKKVDADFDGRPDYLQTIRRIKAMLPDVVVSGLPRVRRAVIEKGYDLRDADGKMIHSDGYIIKVRFILYSVLVCVMCVSCVRCVRSRATRATRAMQWISASGRSRVTSQNTHTHTRTRVGRGQRA